MRKFYNKFIQWTFGIIAVLAAIPLLAVKVVVLPTIKVAKAIRYVVDELFATTMRITDRLVDMLSVED